MAAARGSPGAATYRINTCASTPITQRRGKSILPQGFCGVLERRLRNACGRGRRKSCAHQEVVTFKSRSFAQIHCVAGDFPVSNSRFGVSRGLFYALIAYFSLSRIDAAKRCSSSDTGGTAIDASDPLSNLHHNPRRPHWLISK
jgi:hypothetical protein